jgi:hypothetical protein
MRTESRSGDDEGERLSAPASKGIQCNRRSRRRLGKRERDPLQEAPRLRRRCDCARQDCVGIGCRTVDRSKDARILLHHPLDKARNAERIRRVLAPAESDQPVKPVGIAPLLRALMADYAATGLPPAYLPKDDSADHSSEDS